ncbi:MAG: hypothetical protein RLQ12_21550 [Cyclobacteriaceae bacterium]
MSIDETERLVIESVNQKLGDKFGGLWDTGHRARGSHTTRKRSILLATDSLINTHTKPNSRD